MTNYVHKNDLPANVTVNSNAIAVDTETMGLNNDRDRLCLVQISFGDGDAHIIKFDKDCYDASNLKKLLTDKTITKIFHYARFDVAVIYKYLGIWTEPVYCTKIASKFARTYTESHGLKDLCQELLNKKISKQQQSSDWGGEQLSDAQINYAAADVLYLHQIKDKLDKILQREGRLDFAYSCFDFIKDRVKFDLAGWGEVDIFAHS